MDIDNLPPLIFPSSDSKGRSLISRLKAESKIFSIGPRLYSPLPKEMWSEATLSNWSTIVSTLFPDALLSHRTALEFKPSPEGIIYITSNTSRKVEYQGLTIKFLKGPEVLDDDPGFMSVHTSSLSRAFLENLSQSHKGSYGSKNVTQDFIEKKLESILHLKGEEELNLVRERAREIADGFGWDREFNKLNNIVGALLGTKKVDLVSEEGRARSIGRPYDVSFFKEFELLFASLKSRTWSSKKTTFTLNEHFNNKAFFESYFSNYIEGTTFELEEAEEIVFDNKIPERRPKDAHDIIGTYNIVSDPNEMKRVPRSFDEFEQLLRERHMRLMKSRSEVRPGEYKEKNNRVGNTHFVHRDYLIGTLEQGFKLYLELPEGMARAVYIMFLITEAHPFDDGNGRTARIFMNAELVSVGMSTIIIPNVFREDYVSALRAMSRRERAEPLIKMIMMAYKFSNLDFLSYQKVLEHIKKHHWFEEPRDAKIIL